MLTGMKQKLRTLTLGLTIVIAGFSSRVVTDALKAAETNPLPERIGVYDSRVIAYAHFWSEPFQRELRELNKAAKAARAAGQSERFNELQAKLKNVQKKSHLQVFSTAPVDDVLAEMKDRLPAIQNEAGVARLVSKWDEAELKKYKRAVQVDVTDLFLREFNLDVKTTKVAREIREKKPLPLEKAKELARKGKL